jgi:hypothetical protein
MTRKHYRPLLSHINVYEIGEEDRTYEAITDDRFTTWGVDAKQLSGPTFPIKASELRFKMWGGGGEAPEHPSRLHYVLYEVDGEITPMNEIRGGDAAVEFFKRHGKPGEIGYYIPRTGLVLPGEG